MLLFFYLLLFKLCENRKVICVFIVRPWTGIVQVLVWWVIVRQEHRGLLHWPEENPQLNCELWVNGSLAHVCLVFIYFNDTSLNQTGTLVVVVVASQYPSIKVGLDTELILKKCVKHERFVNVEPFCTLFGPTAPTSLTAQFCCRKNFDSAGGADAERTDTITFYWFCDTWMCCVFCAKLRMLIWW